MLTTLFYSLGFAAASTVPGHLSWSSGREYVFKYEGRMLTGLPDLAPHYSGLAINCTVNLQVKSPVEYAIKIHNAKFSKINEELTSYGN